MNVTIVQNLKPEFAQALHAALTRQYGDAFVIQAFQPNPGRVGIALSDLESPRTTSAFVEAVTGFALGYAKGWQDGGRMIQTTIQQEVARG